MAKEGRNARGGCISDHCNIEVFGAAGESPTAGGNQSPLIFKCNILMDSAKVIAMTSLDLVLTTVNAPYSQQLSAQELAYCLQDQEAAKAHPGHMSSFFGDVQPKLQEEFADLFGIDHEHLVAAAKAFSKYSGASYPLAA